jgi:hypothetical protein
MCLRHSKATLVLELDMSDRAQAPKERNPYVGIPPVPRAPGAGSLTQVGWLHA